MLVKMLRRVWLTCTVIATIDFVICHHDAQGENHCQPASCGDLHYKRYPFRSKNGSSTCLSDPPQLSCEHNRTILKLNNGKYYVRVINYEDYTIQVVDPGLLRDNCLFRPLYPLTYTKFTRSLLFKKKNTRPFLQINEYWSDFDQNNVTFFDCSLPVESPYYKQIDCATDNSSSSSTASYSYIMLGGGVDHLHSSCTMTASTFTTMSKEYADSFSSIRDEMRKGFMLSWNQFLPNRVSCDTSLCGFGELLASDFISAIKITGWSLVARTILGIFVALTYWSYKLHWIKYLKDDYAVEEFLDAYKNLMPRRYSYWDIQMMTNDFKYKLGHGGFGSVYKGELSNSHLVAVKMLSGSKGKGQDFINEVATIGRIHHVNVVQLIGFCSEGYKRALVYDFMPNGSLDKYIFRDREQNLTLSWDRMHDIALGVACAIEYLHRGCDMQILHFDIKPHNILLDKNFKAKVSDFGLARLYPRDHNTISVTAARGTVGYIAPEMFYKTIGGVSYKADVYSFGMLLLEMAGRRKNLNAHAEHSSQIYFPSWIYEQLEKGMSIEIEDACENDKKIAKKMIMVALWCIQLMPADRPSMTKVLEMLEGEDEVLQMPPKPFFCPQQMPTEELPYDSNETDIEDASTLPQSESATELNSMV